MSHPKLGTVPTGNEGRDAVHVAIIPCIAGEDLLPGKHVRIENGVAVGNGDCIGIVDPFGNTVAVGSWFWLCVYPESITELKHQWTSRSLDCQKEVEWITAFASKWKYSFQEFMDGARQYVEHRTLLDDKWEQLEIPDEEWAMFWTHFQTLTGLSRGGKYPEFVTCCPESR